MNTQSKKFDISRITFETGDNEVVLTGTMFQGLMNYASELIISFSQLNSILNQLAKINNGFNIQNHMTKQHMFEDQYMYEVNLNNEINTQVNLASMSSNDSMRLIRA